MVEEYEVGYGKPPLHSRFKKGCSGHPEGRPKGATNVKSELKRLLGAKTKIKVNGAVHSVPTSRALCLALIQKGMAGDVRAFSKIVEIIGAEMAGELRAAASLTREDADLLRRALNRGGDQPPAAPPPSTQPTDEDNKS